HASYDMRYIAVGKGGAYHRLRPPRCVTVSGRITGMSEQRTATRAPGRWRWVRVLIVIAGVAGLAVVGLRGRLPHPGDVLDATAGLAYPWALLAVLLQVTSIAAFALQQQRLFDGLGTRIGL